MAFGLGSRTVWTIFSSRLGFVDLVAQSRALLVIWHRKIKAEHAYGLCRAPVVSRIGLAGSLGWVRLILDRFRDAACPHPDSSFPFIDLGVDEFNFESFGSQRRSDQGFWRRFLQPSA